MNSTPQLLGRDRRAGPNGAFGPFKVQGSKVQSRKRSSMPGAQLGPGDLRMDAAAQAAVGTGDDVFSADELGPISMFLNSITPLEGHPPRLL